MEMDASIALDNAKNMLKNKNLNAVCLNILGQEIKFGSDSTQISFITKNNITQIPLSPKEIVANQITNLAKII